MKTGTKNMRNDNFNILNILLHKYNCAVPEFLSDELPTISVVLCTFNSASYISKCLKSIFDSNYPRDKIEIICVDDGSTDGTLIELRRYPVKIVALAEHTGRAKARNRGIERSSKDIILFVDSDSEIDREMFYYHAVHYKDPSCHCVAGRIIQVGESNIVSMCWETMPWIRIQKLDKEMIKKGLTWAPSGNLSFRANYIKEILFDEKIRGHGEDVNLGWEMAKRGCKPLREEKAIVYHKRKTSLQRLISDMFSRGKSEVTLGTKHKDRLINVAPSFMTVLTLLILLALVMNIVTWKYFLIVPIFIFEYLCIDFIAYIVGYKTFGYYGYIGSKLLERIMTWPIFFLLRIAFETGKTYEALKVGTPELLIKRVCYTEQISRSLELRLHSWALIVALISSFSYVILL